MRVLISLLIACSLGCRSQDVRVSVAHIEGKTEYRAEITLR